MEGLVPGSNLASVYMTNDDSTETSMGKMKEVRQHGLHGFSGAVL